MLETQPTGAGKEALRQWLNTKNIHYALFKKGWVKVDPDTAFPDLQVAPYTEWGNFKGQRKDDGKKHGIVRETEPNGEIYESSYKDDKLHGLHMRFGGGVPQADIYQNGSQKGYIYWNDKQNWT